MDNREQNRAGSMLMLASSMLIFGTIGIFRRYIPLSSGLLAFARGVIGTAFLVLFARLRRAGRRGRAVTTANMGPGRPQKPGKSENAGAERAEKTGETGIAGSERTEAASETKEWHRSVILVLSGALIGINWILLFEAYNYTTVATATLCYYMEPVIVILLSPLFFRERLTGKKLICTAAALAGMALVSGIFEPGGSIAGAAGAAGLRGDNLRGILYGLGAAVLYASVVILNKRLRGVDPYRKTILQLGSAAVCLLPWLLLTGQFSEVEADARSLLLLLVVGIVHTGIAYALYFGSTDGLRAQTIALFSYIDPVSALIFSVLLLHEPMTAAGMAGAVLILGAAFAGEVL